MTPSFPGADELRPLLDALCEGSITPEQMARLEAIVLADPAAEAYYVQFMAFYADLSRHFAEDPGRAAASLRDRTAGPPTVLAPPRRRRFRAWVGVGVFAAGLAVGVLLAVFRPLPAERPPTAKPADAGGERLDHTVAVMVQTQGAEWEDGSLPARPGAALPPGRLLLKSGYARVEFYNGATVILEGPAEFHLISRTEAYCARGKLRATVPPQAHGFTIGSPDLNLVDRGTEFGLEVVAGRQTDVHVFQGKVEVTDAGKPAAKELNTGEGVRVDGTGAARAIPANPTAFLTARQLEVKARDESRRRHDRWLAEGEAIRKDLTLVAHYTFQAGQPWDRTLRDEASGRRDGAIVGCAWGPGRWPGKDGLEFRQVSDRVRVHIPGEFDSVTLAVWVRIDSLPNKNNALLMTDGWDPGEMHWQIIEDGMASLGVQGDGNGAKAHYHGPGAVTPDRFGEWMHLAVTYDKPAGRVTHYRDGQPVASQPVLFDIPLRVGDAELGNWSLGTLRSKVPVRFLNGCMDEFLFFARPLGPDEVERLAAAGRPHS